MLYCKTAMETAFFEFTAYVMLISYVTWYITWCETYQKWYLTWTPVVMFRGMAYCERRNVTRRHIRYGNGNAAWALSKSQNVALVLQQSCDGNTLVYLSMSIFYILIKFCLNFSIWSWNRLKRRTFVIFSFYAPELSFFHVLQAHF